MSNLLNFAKNELDLLGMTEDSKDEMNVAMREHILRMVEAFADEGHSGSSASYAIGILEKILKFEPVTPLTGADEEWVDLSYDGHMKYQNKRCPHVFKDSEGNAYDSDAVVFWEWATDSETGEKFKMHFTSSESRKYITFPYTPTREYRFRESE